MWNYLRVRGEYTAWACTSEISPELPPRARRIQIHFGNNSTKIGTTSACAENTCCDPKNVFLDWNYLRVRGEYDTYHRIVAALLELPPRARRILTDSAARGWNLGTTSACAENTAQHHATAGRCGNYLRVRGEYSTTNQAPQACAELPPRARRIL